MGAYIATFFTHYDAICFQRTLTQQGKQAQLSPVPRRLSSSCGTCVRFSLEGDPLPLVHEELEQLVLVQGEAFLCLYDNR